MDEKSPLLKNNRILNSLSDGEYQRLAPHLEKVDLRHAEVLYQQDGPVQYCYFPSNALISLLTQMSNGSVIEVGLIGNDGMSGIAALMGKETSPERAIVQVPNGGFRLRFSVVKEEFGRGGELQHLLLAYARRFMRQVAQTAACNASHTTEERLSRWLLMCQDRVNCDELKLTQEFIAEMLGTRRATVSVAAMVLQTDGYIKYNRGHIKIVDRPGLQSFTCECYQALRDSE
ncbi:MAG: Crp/Fnr family transcriptional regulator [Acidobacteria bacterium]|nr:Crp/Fnr family transcriptional regulator [Acidobacteriota bacterium]